MAEIKRKVKLKQKVDIGSPDVLLKPEKKERSGWLISISVLGLIIIVAAVYLFLRNNTDSVTDTTVSDQTAQKIGQQVPANSTVQSETGSNQVVSENIKDSEYPENKNTDATNPAAINPSAKVPYNQGESYRIYLFPFGISNYSQPDAELDKLVGILKSNSKVKILISAYTDKVGSAVFNKRLSDKRAVAIRNYIVSAGIDPSRISAKGEGISTKYADDAENRRAEFSLSE